MYIILVGLKFKPSKIENRGAFAACTRGGGIVVVVQRKVI
jgi:hypothetical protein